MTDKETKEEILTTSTTFVPGYKITEIKGYTWEENSKCAIAHQSFINKAKKQYMKDANKTYAIIDINIKANVSAGERYTDSSKCLATGTVVTLEKEQGVVDKVRNTFNK